MSYQSNEAKALSFVDEDLTGFAIFCKQLLEIILRYVIGQVADEQTTPLSVCLLAGFQQHRQRCPELLDDNHNLSFKNHAQKDIYEN